MKRILISVEGQTEETFVRDVLAPHLESFKVYPTSVIISTGTMRQGNKYRGGGASYGKVKNEVVRLLKDTHAVAISTMYDLYKLPTDFPGFAARPTGDCFQKAAYLESKFREEIADPRFRPYLQVHEFEAFLFVNPEITARVFSKDDKLKELARIKSGFNSPEEINDGVTTAPSKRILSLFPNYEKPLYGALVVVKVGLDAIRAECPHFNEWLTWLEGLGMEE